MMTLPLVTPELPTINANSPATAGLSFGKIFQCISSLFQRFVIVNY